MNKRYVVRLTEEERSKLLGLVGAGKAAARKLRRARILLKVDEDGPGWTDEQVAEALDVGTTTVQNARQRFVEEGLEAAINRKKQTRPSRMRKLDGEAEARLLALACSKPPEGRKRWTMHLLADQLVALEVVESVSHDTIWRALKKTRSSRT
jgi:transposase